MTTPPARPAAPQQPTAPPAKAGLNVRLIVLLGILGVVVAMLLVDLVVFKPAAIKAQEDLTVEAEKKMRAGVSAEGGKDQQHFFTAADVERVVGRKASWEKSNPKGDHVIQTFAWWGQLPLNRHRFDVLYRKGSDGTLIYESHDGTLEFVEVEDVKAVPANLPVRTGEGDAKKGELDTTVPGAPPGSPPGAPPAAKPAVDPPADAGTTTDEAPKSGSEPAEPASAETTTEPAPEATPAESNP